MAERVWRRAHWAQVEPEDFWFHSGQSGWLVVSGTMLKAVLGWTEVGTKAEAHPAFLV